MKVESWTFALPLLLAITVGCNRLSPGQLNTASPPTTILIRGYLDWYSTGMDQLANELNSDRIPATAFREEQWGDIADSLVNHPRQPLVLIGFSYGADDVILIARKLNERNLPVDLLITIDPVTPANIPPNVKQCVNFYEPNGFWDLFPWLRGIPVTGDNNTPVENINIRANPDLNEPDTSHATISANEKIHRNIRQRLARLIKD